MNLDFLATKKQQLFSLPIALSNKTRFISPQIFYSEWEQSDVREIESNDTIF